MRGGQTIAALLTAIITLAIFIGIGSVTINAFSNAESTTAASSNIKFFKYPNNIGVNGYDVISYFELSKAVKGNPNYEAEWGGLKWHFTSSKNYEKFLANPQKYIPQYGGHCAYGVAQGYLVRGDPTAWSVHNGKLYINYNANIRTAWLADATGFVESAEKAWKTSLNR
ncbi:MAG: YHS domain-containing (seleno)protein [Gammaproteobacteria bacterium WSBS_2016_MAG_OTU1]